MTLTWHIIKKDLRLLRWVLPVWLALSAFETINRVIGPFLAAQDQRWLFVLPMWTFVISIAYGLQLMLLIANHIQAERLVGTTAFWLTRPIPRGLLLRSKLLALTLFVLLPTLLLEGILMAMFQVPALTIVFAWIQQAWVMAVIIFALVFAATLTSTATRMLFLIVGVFIAVYFVFMTMISIAMARTTFENTGPYIPASDPTGLVIVVTLCAMAGLAAIGYHYLRRRPVIAVAILAIGVGISVPIGSLWAGNLSLFGGVPTLEREAWARDPSITRLRVRSGERMSGETRSFSDGPLHERAVRYLSAPIVLDGVPSNYDAQPFTMAGQLRFDDGTTVRSMKSSPQNKAIAVTTGQAPSMGSRDYVRMELWPTLMLAPVEQYREHGDKTGVYTGTFIYTFTRHDTLAEMPLTIGSSYHDGSRTIFVSNLRYELDACIVTFRATSVGLLTDWLSRPRLVPRFHQRGGLELKDQRGGGGGSLSINVMSSGAMFMFAPHPVQMFDLEYRMSKPVFPIADELHATSPPCDQIDLAIERTTFAGTLTRTLELRDFRMNDARPMNARQ